MAQALVIKSTGSWYIVRDTTTQQELRCRLRGKIKLEGRKTTNPVAVGDFVQYELEGEVGVGVIHEIERRENYIIRKSVHKAGHGHIIAANMDQVMLIASLHLPRTSTGFIDRFLVAAETFRIPAFIVFNKWDLLNEEDQELVQVLAYIYKNVGYDSIFTSAETGLGLEEFKSLLAGKKTLLSGHSGVGKSTLVNAVAPHLTLKTAEVSTFANKGVHTTTFAEMHFLAPETAIVDTPGIKELGIVDIEKSEMAHFFPEMRALLNQCRYDNCIHINEPACAVIAAVEAGTISFTRYESYLSLMQDDDNHR
jgi:ribosome biogenesis GTPase / thiamine phosphate phosphatase